VFSVGAIALVIFGATLIEDNRAVVHGGTSHEGVVSVREKVVTEGRDEG
jgi:hypothetical protein